MSIRVHPWLTDFSIPHSAFLAASKQSEDGRIPHLKKMVGTVRFELTTSWTRTKRATKLRYVPTSGRILTVQSPQRNAKSSHAKREPRAKTRRTQSFLDCNPVGLTCWSAGPAARQRRPNKRCANVVVICHIAAFWRCSGIPAFQFSAFSPKTL